MRIKNIHITSAFSYEREGCGMMIILALLLCAFATIHYLAGHHLVMTVKGLKVYPKDYFSLHDTYVDIRRLPAEKRQEHLQVISKMIEYGDLPAGSDDDVKAMSPRSIYFIVEEPEEKTSASFREMVTK